MNKKIIIDIEQKITYNHKIEVVKTSENVEDLNLVLDELEGDDFGANLDEIAGRLREGGYEVIEICEDGSPEVENEFYI